MSVSPIGSTYKAAATSDETEMPVITKKKTQLGQEDFLKLLAVQFKSQDPMKPMEDTAFIAQMAQFTSLDQSSAMVTQMTQMRTQQDIATANSYIGRLVTFEDANEQILSGDVSGVDISDGTPRLIIGGKNYPLSSVLLVEPGTATANTTTAPQA